MVYGTNCVVHLVLEVVSEGSAQTALPFGLVLGGPGYSVSTW